MNSLRRRLLVSLLACIAAAFALGGYATYRLGHDEIDEVMDYHLRQLSLSLRDRFLGEETSPLGAPDKSLDFVIQIWDREGLRRYLSHPHSELPAQARLGYDTVKTREGNWRVFSLQLSDRVIQVAQPMRIRSRLAAAAALRTLTPMLLMFPILGLLIWLVIGRGLRPLEDVARAVSRRHPNALDPLSITRAPDEVRTLVEALNGLLARLDHALATQRAFVADAAHELRTPLTALQLQLQLTERATDDNDRNECLGDLKLGLHRATHVVQQLLTLARQEPDGAEEKPFGPVALAHLAGLAITDHAPQAESRQIDLGASGLDSTAEAEGDAAALRTLLGNLVDNAIRYTPNGGTVDVRAGLDGNNAWLEVSDSGPGIPPEDRTRVFDRFYRREGQTETGSGLGLAIVQAIADRHGARIELDDATQGGLRVRIEWPARRSRA